MEGTQDVLDADRPVEQSDGTPVDVLEVHQQMEARGVQQSAAEDQRPLGAQRDGRREADHQAEDGREQVGIGSTSAQRASVELVARKPGGSRRTPAIMERDTLRWLLSAGPRLVPNRMDRTVRGHCSTAPPTRNLDAAKAF